MRLPKLPIPFFLRRLRAFLRTARNEKNKDEFGGGKKRRFGHLVQADDVGVLEQLQGRDLPLYLLVDLHGEDALAVEDLDGEGLARLGVARQLHLAEVAFPQRPPHLVLPHQHCLLPAGRC
jgi:hypothetical protein